MYRRFLMSCFLHSIFRADFTTAAESEAEAEAEAEGMDGST